MMATSESSPVGMMAVSELSMFLQDKGIPTEVCETFEGE